MQATGERDIVVRIPPARSDTSEPQRESRVYEVFVYSELPLSLGGERTRDQPAAWRGLSLAGVGRLTVHWSRYQDYVANFQQGLKAAAEMYERLRRTLSPELARLVEAATASRAACRVWWASEAPELDDMPWDILFYGYGQQSPACTFVRGAPPQLPPPILPLSGPLRLAWSDTWLTPQAVRRIFDEPLPGIETIPLKSTSRDCLRRAAAEGYELLHLCTDGIVSLASEGILYDHGDRESPELTAHELSTHVRGRRLSVIGLGIQDFSNPDVMQVQGREVVSAYRAFANLASSKVALPSLAVPVGPMADQALTAFWREFYSRIGDTHRLDVALASARRVIPESTIALFLRHPQGKLFRTATRRSGPEAPEQMLQALRSSLDASQRLDALRGRYGQLPSYLEGVAKEQGERQTSLESTLLAWSRPEEDEL